MALSPPVRIPLHVAADLRRRGSAHPPPCGQWQM